jgi:ribonuclease T2
MFARSGYHLEMRYVPGLVMVSLMLASCSVQPMSDATLPAKALPKLKESGRVVRDRTQSFDFYVLSLSWSPGFCATPAGRNEDFQCGPTRHYGFVLHGLWPQYEKGGWPQDCPVDRTAGRVDSALVDEMLPIMPSPKLVRHEWQKHGTCSGLSVRDYFDEATDAFHSITIPARYEAPQQAIQVDPDQLRADFAQANPTLGHDGFVVLCSGNGRYLQEVRACLRSDLSGRACNREVQRSACRSDQITLRPTR